MIGKVLLACAVIGCIAADREAVWNFERDHEPVGYSKEERAQMDKLIASTPELAVAFAHDDHPLPDRQAEMEAIESFRRAAR